jgi:hypothetical protein
MDDISSFKEKGIESDVIENISPPYTNDGHERADVEFLSTIQDLSQAFSHEDPFPVDEDAEQEDHQFTFRAVFVGCILGGVIAASK